MEQTIWNWLINAGMTSAGAAGMMGNLYAESALKPNNWRIFVKSAAGSRKALLHR